ncbi:MAG: putative glycoside hydrolase [Candidatus Gastranaerophilales bacterium]|nr:putative glycoside hydrolase [Candidatus Gastranaerophilales bacterium]
MKRGIWIGILFFWGVCLSGCGAEQSVSAVVEREVNSSRELPDEETEDAQHEEEPWERERPEVRGIYVTGPRAGSASMEELIALLDETELNSMVIDVKNDEGNLTYRMDLEAAEELGACINYIPDMAELMAKLKEHDIYTIARIVCFKDPYLAQGRPELALLKADGTPLTDAYGLAWVNPYEQGVWEYLTQVAEAAVDIGFDEIQFDYVRFPIGDDGDHADYGVDAAAYPREQAITDFLDYAAERIHAKGALITADVFGTIIGSETDKNTVGQDYVSLGDTVDVLSPMVYPSHYGNGVFGLDVPDAHPYDTVYAALCQSAEELSVLPVEDRAIVRPWLQAFTASWVPGYISYEGAQIREQIQAVYDAGYREWILWNSTNRYSADGLETADHS